MDRKVRATEENLAFHFDPAKHEYRLGSRLLPGFSQIRIACGINHRYGSELESQMAMDRGKAVHRCTELYDQGKIVWSTVKDEIYGYLMAWIKFREETGYIPNMKFRETPMYHPLYLYATIPDCGDGKFSATKGGGTALVEIKTGAKEDWHTLQTAAQELILPKRKNKKRIVVYLEDDGTYKADVHADPMDSRVFLSLIVEFNWRLKHGYI